MTNRGMSKKSSLRQLNHILTEFDRFDIFMHSIILAYRGSIVHGTYEASKDSIDDKDVIGVAIPPVDYIIGLNKFEQFERMPPKLSRDDPWDVVIYEIRKFFRLLLKSNPNVLGLLWLPENGYISRREEGRWLIDNRDIFSSKQAYKSFTGYAYGQLHRMTHHTYHGYMGTKRKELVDKFGYDTKNASHLIRLLRMGIEFMATGELNVLREDASQLIQIKHGEWTLNKVYREADKLFAGSEEALIHSKLPEKPDREKANELLCKIIRSYHGLE